METMNVKIDELQTLNGFATLTVLEGKALEQKPPEKVNISGDIKTVATFIKSRTAGYSLQAVDKNRAVVYVDKQKLSIQLILDPENHYGAVVYGKLEDAEELKPFFINANKYFSKEELVKLIKFSKMYFEDAEKHAAMLLAFQKVSSVVNIKANESSDDRGNKERAFVKEVTSNAPTEFSLFIPIFKGYPPYRFKVEVCLDVNEGTARFWFESIALHELRLKLIEEIFDEQLKAAEGFAIINK